MQFIDSEKDDFNILKERMEKIGIYEVMVCNGCDNLRDNKLGIYCRCGTRKVRRFKEFDKIVCLNCDANRIDRLQVSKEEFERLENKR